MILATNMGTLIQADDTQPPTADDQPPTTNVDDRNDDDLIQVENALLKAIEMTKLSAEVTGRIAALSATEGILVDQNQALGKIDDRAVRLQQQRAKSSLEIAKHKAASKIDLQLAEKRSAVAKNELDRAQAANLRVANTYSTKEIERLQLVYDTTILEIERAKHDQRLLALEVSLMENDQRVADHLALQHQIQSPVAGMIVSVNKHQGEWVEPGTELLEIVKLDRLRIEGFLSADHAGVDLVQQSAKVKVQLGNREVTLDGKVVFVFPEINPVNNQMRIHLEIENPNGRLRPGMRVQAAIRR